MIFEDVDEKITRSPEEYLFTLEDIQAKYTEEKKADAIMTLPEIYYKPRNVDSLVSYLEDVSHAAPSLPLLYYHFPMMSGVNVNIPEFFSLASSRIPNFKGMKADLDAAMQVNDLLRDDQKIFIGNHMISPAVLLGHESSIATVTNMLPDLVQGIVAASKKGDVASVRDQQMRMNRIVDAITSQGEFLPSMKAAMYMMTGIRVGKPRRPMAALDEKRVRVIKDNLKNLLTTTFDF
ncbi:N-acetylneuraminate lyase-like [Hyposmocoma kahamanoa]|uniref:N-acetylneuraminate lyase-like n=1 Tax=Hyposmocoma kahamanoa TaxID=1477025 RepID=UPI000E6D694A|nr:N-acetylneuraminate lyase-like [Hyposmocoma kahamanoa]